MAFIITPFKGFEKRMKKPESLHICGKSLSKLKKIFDYIASI